jgi:hypothetical protein
MQTLRIVLVSLLTFLAIPVALGVTTLGHGGVLDSFMRGGFFMYLVVLLLLAQLALAVLATGLEHHEPMPLGLHLLGPLLVAVAGAGGTMYGLSMVYQALAVVDPAQKQALFFVGASEASTTTVFALAGAGVALLGVALSGSLAAFARRDDDAGRGFGGALLATLAGPLGLWALGRAVVGAQLAAGQAALQHMDPASKTMVYAGAVATAAQVRFLMHLAVGLAFLAGLALLVITRRGAGAYFGRRLPGFVAGVAAICLGVTAVMGARLQERGIYERLRLGEQVELPDVAVPVVDYGAALDAATPPFAEMTGVPPYGVYQLTLAAPADAKAVDVLERARGLEAESVFLLVKTQDLPPSPERERFREIVEDVGAYPIVEPKAFALPLRLGAPSSTGLPVLNPDDPDAMRDAEEVLVLPKHTASDLARALTPLGRSGPALVTAASKIRDIEMPGTLTREQIREVVSGLNSRLKLVLERTLMKHPDLNTKIVAELTIDPDGTVAMLKLEGEGPDELKDGMREVLKAARFPPPLGPVTVRYPFILHASE